MSSKRRHVAVEILGCLGLLFVLIGGCGGHTGGGGNNNNAPIYCESEDECPAGWTCDNNVCMPRDASVEPDVPDPVPEIEVDPLIIDFGSSLIGVPVTEVATITNAGTGDLTIFSITLEQDGQLNEFAAQPTGQLNQVLAPGETLEVTVELTNQDEVADEGRLLISSDDADEALVQVQLTSELKGDIDLVTCVMTTDAYDSDCVTGPEVIDYGTMDYDATAFKDVSLINNASGNRPLIISDIYVTNSSGHGDLFSVEYFQLVEDGTGFVREELVDFPNEPYLLSLDNGVGAPEVMIVRVSFHALVEGQAVPDEDLVIESDDPIDAVYEIPIVGSVLCPPDHYDYDGQPGCEYFCEITNGGVETCDGSDNNCDGNIDENVSPGLCLVCDPGGAPVVAADDLNCGTIDCSGWFQQAGPVSPTDTDQCYGREAITTNRCEGDADCKDANSEDCNSQPLLGTPTLSCGICQYVDGCSGSTTGTCANFGSGTPTTLCMGCDGAGGEMAVSDDDNCGVIDCSGWYTIAGTEGPTETNACHGRLSIMTDRCEGAGDCKDPNSADCEPQAADTSTATATCGTCQRVIGCLGSIPGACENYAPGISTGVCRECDGLGGEQASTDDNACGTIDCGGWFITAGTLGPTDTQQCYAHQDITSNRCEGMDDCRDANSTDCAGQPTLGTPALECGTCQYMQGCTGTSTGSCADYPLGEDTGLCRECDGNGAEQASTDDSNCGTIDCSGWYENSGTMSPTDTERCFGHQSISSSRCEGMDDCRDANTIDCDTEPLLGTAAVECGTCQYMSACVGTTAGYCSNYSSGTDTGLCKECDGAGSERAAQDDNGCGIIECGGWYTTTGTQGQTDTEQCFGHQDLTSGRCEGLDDCKDPNTGDCGTQPLEGTPTTTCGLCKFMAGCSGTTAGSCTNYAGGTDTGLCRECDGSGAERAGADDDTCGIIACSGWFSITGNQSATDTEYCYGHQDITSSRCEGLDDCKDANTSDCSSQALVATPSASCSTCRYMSGCTGTTPGSCSNYAGGTDTGLCRECDGSGSERSATDDNGCGTIECGGWYATTGTQSPTDTEYCYGHQDLGSNRCEGIDNCKDPNSTDCTGQPLEAAPSVTCGTCQYMAGCAGAVPGSCTNYGAGTDTGLCRECDSSGAERAAADDDGCGLIECGSWYSKTGTAGATTTENCYGHQDLAANRCEDINDCKDANSIDCDGQPLEGAPGVSCGLCQYMSGCAGVAPGTCDNYGVGLEAGLCQVCDGAGGVQADSDDNGCGTIECGAWYSKTGTLSPTNTEYCYGHQDMTSGRCEGVGDCKDANSVDCAGEPLEGAPGVTCGTCKLMVGCSGVTSGSCDNYVGGTDTGLCRECDGTGAERAAADDDGCGTIECGGWYTITGTAGAEDTEYCYGHQDLASIRCEGMDDCKDANSGDCAGQPLEAAPAVTCGICRYMAGCAGATGGSCDNYVVGTEAGLCRQCNGAGGVQAQLDDALCGTIECGGWYTITGTQGPTDNEFCYGRQDITSDRCEAVGDCKDANSADCNGEPLEGAPSITCGTCTYMTGCTGSTAGSCTPYGAGTDTGLCRACDGAGGEQSDTDDAGCGTIECGGWYTKTGTAGAEDTEYCYGHQDLVSNRCEGMDNCKDANSGDCSGEPLEAAPAVTCGTCKYMSGCAGATGGSCDNYGVGTDAGLCQECNGAGGVQADTDDNGCGTIECGGWYSLTGTAGPLDTEFCYGHVDITSNRCEGVANCKDDNTVDCNPQGLEGAPSQTCGVCTFMTGCFGTTTGSCQPYPNGTLTAGTCGIGNCTADWACDGAGNNLCTPGPQTGDDSDCDGQDDNCNGSIDENYAPTGTCGVGVCLRDTVCSSGSESCTPGLPTGPDNECNGLDEDCSGVADDNFVPATCGLGICLRNSTCVAGSETCSPGPSGTETCSNFGTDDDCDGDPTELENGIHTGDPCVLAGYPGQCANGTWQCQGANLACVSNCLVYNSTDTPIDLLDDPDACEAGAAGIIISNLNVPFSCTIADIYVYVNINHTYIGDLGVYLNHPDGQFTILHEKTGGSANNIIGTYDTTLALWGGACSPPCVPLNGHNGKDTAGTWWIDIWDYCPGDSGIFLAWTLYIDCV